MAIAMNQYAGLLLQRQGNRNFILNHPALMVEEMVIYRFLVLRRRFCDRYRIPSMMSCIRVSRQMELLIRFVIQSAPSDGCAFNIAVDNKLQCCGILHIRFGAILIIRLIAYLLLLLRSDLMRVFLFLAFRNNRVMTAAAPVIRDLRKGFKLG